VIPPSEKGGKPYLLKSQSKDRREGGDLYLGVGKVEERKGY